MRKTVNAEKNLTEGKILKTMLIFAFPMIMGNLLQQIYNIADTMVVGRFLGAEALAAVGSAYTLMTFLTFVIIGLCMGSGAVFSIAYGAGNQQELKKSMWVSFVFVGIVTIIMNAAVFVWTEPILRLLQIPEEVYPLMHQYIRIIFSGILFVFYIIFCVSAPGSRKFCCSFMVPGGVFCFKHHSGSMVCGRTWERCGRCGCGNGDRTDGSRAWDCCLYFVEGSNT